MMLSRNLVLAIVLVTLVPASNATAELTFVQISDAHFSPDLVRIPEAVALRGAATVAWIQEHAAGPQAVQPWGLTTPMPAYAVFTGDVFEFGVIDRTAEQLERAFGDWPFPVWVLPGNHDNTWGALYRYLRARHGGTNYAVDRGGVRLLNISSASPQEPVPSIDGGTRAWLREQLDQTPAGQPVIVALHHPLHDKTLAPAEYDTLIDLLRDHHVVLALYGHGHSVVHHDHDGIDGVMGGSTYGRNGGYAVAQITSDRVRVAYHYQDDPRDAESNAPGWRPVLDKPLAAQPAPRTLTITAPPPGVTVTDERLRVEVATAGPAAEYRDWSVTLNGRPIGVEPAVSGRNAAFELSLDPLDAGRAWTTIRATAPDGTRDVRTVAFHVGSDVATGRLWQAQLPTGFKAAPTVLGDAVVLAGTDGRVVALDRATGETRWTFTTGGEILGTPAVRGDLLILGSGDGSLYALDGGGRLRWMQDLGAAIYAPPTLSEDVVFVGDLTGRLHARDATNGRALWTFARADYGIEAAAVVWDDLVICGAWDGYLYAVDRATGELRWRTLGPKSSEGRGVRYYAPADCPPALLGDQLLVTDRGYVLAAYDRVGRQGNPVDLNIAGVAAATDGSALYARAVNDRVVKYAADGRKLWEVETPAGRFPIQPTVTADGVFVASNAGLVQRLDPDTGAVTWRYQATAGFYVMAPVTVADGVCYVAAMDGTVTAVRVNSASID